MINDLLFNKSGGLNSNLVPLEITSFTIPFDYGVVNEIDVQQAYE